MVRTNNWKIFMVICDTCKLKELGCVAMKLVIASGNNQCSLYSAQKMEKISENQISTVSWSVGDKRVIQTSKDGQILSNDVIQSSV